MRETKSDSDDHAAQKLPQRDDINNNNINPKLKERFQAEHDLVGEFISIIGKHHERIVQQRRQAEDMIKQLQQQQKAGAEATMSREEFQTFATTTLANTPQLTETEQRILSRTYYQNWNAGIMAGATTFGLLMGFSHWSARRLAARRGILPPPPKKSYTTIDHPQQHHYKPSASSNSINKSISNNNAQFQQMDVARTAQQQRQQSWAMDPLSVPASSSSSFLKNNFKIPTAASASTRAAVAGDESIMPQIQLMVYGGMAIVVTILTSFATIDKMQFYHELAKLPLAPGKSHLCHGACPEVMEKYQNFMAMKTPTTTLTRASTSGAVKEEHHVDIDPASILKDPMTEEAEAMARLVINCQQRMQYEKDHQDSNNNSNANEVVVVDVPKPGVPSNYSGLSVRVTAATP